jgi:hypothetical protein
MKFSQLLNLLGEFNLNEIKFMLSALLVGMKAIRFKGELSQFWV